MTSVQFPDDRSRVSGQSPAVPNDGPWTAYLNTSMYMMATNSIGAPAAEPSLT